MQDKHLDDDMIQPMLDWLSRNMDISEQRADLRNPAELTLTEEDHRFLRDCRTAIL